MKICRLRHVAERLTRRSKSEEFKSFCLLFDQQKRRIVVFVFKEKKCEYFGKRLEGLEYRRTQKKGIYLSYFSMKIFNDSLTILELRIAHTRTE